VTWILVAVLVVAVVALVAERQRWRAQALVLGVLIVRGPVLTSYSIYRLLDRRVNLGALHLALGELERRGLVYLALDEDANGPHRVATLRVPSPPKGTEL
jgi:hypothetical protein